MPFARNVHAAIISLLGIPLRVGLGCTGGLPGATGVTEVTPAEAQALIQARENDPDFVILDVRNPGEFAAGHIADAVNVCFLCSSFDEDVAGLDASKTYLVYCASDNRSGQATAKMAQQGFSNLYDLSGGIKDWQDDGLPLVP